MSASATTDATPISGVRQRTRAAILEAALHVWARDWSASLADIADAATVSRSTLHRYFADRQALVDATFDHAMAVLGGTECAPGSTAAAADRPAGEILEENLRGAIDAGDAVIFLFTDTQRFAHRPEMTADEEDHSEITALIRRAQSEGSITADVAAEWVVGMFYSVVYVAAEGINSGHLPRHRAGDIAVRTFFGGLGA